MSLESPWNGPQGDDLWVIVRELEQSRGASIAGQKSDGCGLGPRRHPRE